eukprot:TRINITY_DN55731_c0_g1_i1.p1 TRINITY_DN55731_c0_g1~~TRINITY_DN55731_c0_g1_i1.p1  ORF type:complete len:416 (+),score=89.34 TRINITY_DN55731_c0_g1_i1:56-1303(+)
MSCARRVFVALCLLVAGGAAIRRHDVDGDEDDLASLIEVASDQGANVTDYESFLNYNVFDELVYTVDALKNEMSVLGNSLLALHLWSALKSLIRQVLIVIRGLLLFMAGILKTIEEILRGIVNNVFSSLLQIFRSGPQINWKAMATDDRLIEDLKGELKSFDKIDAAYDATLQALNASKRVRDAMGNVAKVETVITRIRDLGGFANASSADDAEAGSLMEAASSLSGEAVFIHVPWFENAWRHVKERLLEKLLPETPEITNDFDTSVETLTIVKSDLESLKSINFDGMPAGVKEKYVEEYGGQLARTLLALPLECESLTERITTRAHPLVQSLYEVTFSFKDDAESYVPGSIEKSKCARRSMRFFSLATDVDETSMWCKSVLGKKVCGCNSKSHCYVREAQRPAPKEKARCFQPV